MHVDGNDVVVRRKKIDYASVSIADEALSLRIYDLLVSLWHGRVGRRRSDTYNNNNRIARTAFCTFSNYNNIIIEMNDISTKYMYKSVRLFTKYKLSRIVFFFY